ncbi:MAG: hypothetical protein L0216_12520 [Planctomycetales bacterium]|nr:hypothetical protein [Planctomycetales bacterium]
MRRATSDEDVRPLSILIAVEALAIASLLAAWLPGERITSARLSPGMFPWPSRPEAVTVVDCCPPLDEADPEEENPGDLAEALLPSRTDPAVEIC